MTDEQFQRVEPSMVGEQQGGNSLFGGVAEGLESSEYRRG
jgi:hypothetical protein